MIPIAVIATGAVSSLGRGRDAYRVGAVGARPETAVCEAAWLKAAGLRRPFAALVARPLLGDRSAESFDPAGILLNQALSDLARMLDLSRPGWRTERVALCLGTSSGGMASQIEWFERAGRGEPLTAELAVRAPYFGPVRGVRTRLGLGPGLDVQVLCACASSTFAIGLGCRWLELGVCDVVITGGYDAVTLLVAAGFESLAATSACAPRPFCTDRDGLSLGDGAAVLALARATVLPENVLPENVLPENVLPENVLPENVPPGDLSLGDVAPGNGGFALLGFGASADAHHPTAPDPSGRWLGAAAAHALADAGVAASDIAVVSAHGTATAYNDAAELNALRELGLGRPLVHPYKSVIGHTLGAAGALELLALREAWTGRILPASAATGALEPVLESQIRDANGGGNVLPALKLSAAFGGANAALVVGEPRPSTPRAPRRVGLLALGEPCHQPDVALMLRAGVMIAEDRLWRLDDASAIALTAVAQVQSRGLVRPGHERCGIVVGSAVATLEANARFDRRRSTRGAASVEPRRFPATSPNLGAGYVAMAFGWHGPTVAVGAGLAAALEALLVAHDLVASGDAELCWCVAGEVLGETASAMWHAAGWPLPAAGAAALLLGTEAACDQMVGWLVRATIQHDLAQAEQQHGAYSGLEPGWPSLLAAGRAAAAGA